MSERQWQARVQANTCRATRTPHAPTRCSVRAELTLPATLCACSGRNFAQIPQSGLKILPYKNSTVTHATDRELAPLSRYLTHIATGASHGDFTTRDHAQWKEVVEALPGAQ